MAPRGTANTSGPERRTIWNSWIQNPELAREETFLEATGEVGDVYLLHPFMLHSASRNLLRTPRIITNPPVSLNEPFNYNRTDPSEYSLVEQKTLKDLGKPEGLADWKITMPRERVIPLRITVSNSRKFYFLAWSQVLTVLKTATRRDEEAGT
jgi:hypothetical protein